MKSNARFRTAVWPVIFGFVFAPNALMAKTPTRRPAAKTEAKSAPRAVKGKAANKKDLLAPGIQAFQKKNYPEALRLFGVALKTDAKNPLAWIYHARAIVAVNAASEPEDYCNEAKNWIFDALASLTKAYEINRSKAEVALQTATEPSFQKFRTRPEFKNWNITRLLPLKTDLATQDFFAKNNDWLLDKKPMPPTVITFAPDHALTIAAADGARDVGTWSAGADRVVVKTKAALRTLNLTTSFQPFDAGKKRYKMVILKDMTNPTEQWTMGPLIADCGGR